MPGAHTLKSWSTSQAVLALSSGEAEYYAIVKAASVALGIRSLAADLGIQFESAIAIKSDASAAIGISSRLGIGKVRHIEVTQLWVQEKVASGEIAIHKVATEDNLADALTKAVDAHVIQKHVLGTNAEVLSDRHPLTPMIAGDEGGAIKDEEELGTEEESNDNRNHEINMMTYRYNDHTIRNRGDRRSGDEE